MALTDRYVAPFLLGTIFYMFLYGVLVMQCRLYFSWYKTDRTLVKAVVWLLLAIGAIMGGFNIAMSYGYLVRGFGNFNNLQLLSDDLVTFPLFTGVTAFIVQCFYGWRIRILTGLRSLSACIYVMALISLLGSIGTTISGAIIRDFTKLDRTTPITMVWLVGASATDIVITISLVWYLSKNKTGFSVTDDLVSKIIRVTIQTGMLTAAASVGVVIGFRAGNATPIGVGVGIPVSLLYSTSLLSTLNARRGWVPLTRRLKPQKGIHINIGGESSNIRFGMNADNVSDAGSQKRQSGNGIRPGSEFQVSPTLKEGASFHGPKPLQHAKLPSRELGHNAGLVGSKSADVEQGLGNQFDMHAIIGVDNMNKLNGSDDTRVNTHNAG